MRGRWVKYPMVLLWLVVVAAAAPLAGKLTGFTGLVTGHETLAGRLIHPRAFDVRGCKHTRVPGSRRPRKYDGA